MQVRKATERDLRKALVKVNKRYHGNVAFDKLQPNGKAVTFRLRVSDVSKPGHRRGYQNYDLRTGEAKGKPKRLHYACWHVHGHFFEALLAIAPDALIRAGTMHNSNAPHKITAQGGNWQDWNQGSQMFPQYASELCDCAEDGLE